MKSWKLILVMLGIVLVNILAQFVVFRIDLTQDKRHTLSGTTKDILRNLEDEVEVTVYLKGDFNSGFLRLSNSTKQILDEMRAYGHIRYQFVNPLEWTENDQNRLNEALSKVGLHPTAIYESADNGSRSETIVYPFALIRYQSRQQYVNLLSNRRDLSGAENLNQSVEALEYRLMMNLSSLINTQREKVVFIEGHGELPEQRTEDVQKALAAYYDIYRGTMTGEADCLNDFKAVIIADPQLPFSEADKYILDQYIMQGGRVLWCVNGVKFSEQVLEDEGFTPALAMDLNLTDMLFKYGVRINNHLLQDMQCISVPVDVSRDPERPQWQPMPWPYAPLLLTSNNSAITYNLSPVNAMFCSDLSAVGETESITHNILLATSEHSRMVPVPGEINLNDFPQDISFYDLSYLPVADAIEGAFPSLFTHRMVPEGVINHKQTLSQSAKTKQIVVASGSIIENDVQNGMALPAGYDRYSKIQFSNRDFIVNSVLWLTDHEDLLNLRKKEIPLRLLNKERIKTSKVSILGFALGMPMILLVLTAIVVISLRKRKYANRY